jgi:hypothetical protein
MSIDKVDICDYLSWSSLHPSVGHLYLDPKKYGKPPLAGEPLRTNPHWMQLKDVLLSWLLKHPDRLPCAMVVETNPNPKCKLCNRLYKPHHLG